MKKILFIVVFLYCYTSVVGQEPAWEWVKQFHGGSSQCRAITVDEDGNIYITGYYGSTTDFDPDTGTYYLSSGNGLHAFILKLNNLGNLIWAKAFIGSTLSLGNKIAIDSNHNVYLTGDFYGTVDFDPDTGIFNLTASNTDIFNCKLDSNGNLIWANSIQGFMNDYSGSITIDSSGFVYTTGYLYGVADLDPGGGTFYIGTNNINTAYILKLDSNGNFVWAKAFSNAAGMSISLDSKGNIITTGAFLNSTDFDPNAGVYMLNNTGRSIYISKLNNDGNFIWAKGFINQNANTSFPGSTLAITSENSLLITGSFNQTFDFNPDGNPYLLTSNNSNKDIFIAKLDSNGNFGWAKVIGNSEDDFGTSITSDVNSNIILVGRFKDTIDFDPGVGVHYCISYSNYAEDIFVLKLDSSGNFSWVKTGKGNGQDYGNDVCVNFNNEVFITGSFNGLSISFGGIVLHTDSIGSSENGFISKISACATESQMNDNACNYYVSPTGNLVWTSSGIHTDTLTNSVGCDSIVVVDLTLFSSSSTQIITTCISYTSPNSNNTWTSSGIYSDTIPNALGCDSIITINLTINSVDSSITQSGNSLTANATATYQWLNCDSSLTAITGATNQTYTATANGNYAVVITQNGCTDTSACVTVTGVGINEIDGTHDFILYPNPTTNNLTIQLNALVTNGSIILNNTMGQVVYASVSNQKSTILNLKSLPAGLYFVHVITDKGSTIQKVVKQ